MSAETLLSHWEKKVKRAVGIQQAEVLLETAHRSVGMTEGLQTATWEIQGQYRRFLEDLADIDSEMEALLADVPGAQDMMAIKGVKLLTVATFFAEVGDITQYKQPRQVQNLAVFSLRLHESGTFKGQTKISKRG